ncbi:putative tyrosinase-like protein tyr-3 [Smittium culicis]|uniref:Putative tyrosinase-like protein tyr-3 n=1 Tax=Smittium culicis TaxID=133412 RepID=A0A1R1Y4L7_9FUNG|nr:putative tyrosinase-like protein tyr-3 [Smittium culicis]
MRINFIVLLVTVALFSFGSCQKCRKIRVRKELRSLSKKEWNIYKDTLTKMHAAGWFDWFARLHQTYFEKIHGTNEFLPWHRHFIMEWENLAATFDPGYVQPYWDSASDFVDVAESVTSDIQTSANFTDFSMRLELGMHNTLHRSIGGDMGKHHSTVDALFMLHHTNVDRIWWKYQNYKEVNMMDFDESLDKKITYFDVKVRDLMQIGQGGLLYRYEERGNSQSINKRSSVDSNSNENSENSENFGENDRLSDDPSDISTILKTPEMSLATGVSRDILKKYFPDLYAGSVNIHSIDLPNVISSRALEYAKNIKSANAGMNDSNQNVTTSPVNNSIPDTLVEISKLNTASPSKVGMGTPINQRPKMPYPARMPDDFLKEFKVDINFYNNFYKEKLDLIDALNEIGYVSPYI